jgi:hypothetical protein
MNCHRCTKQEKAVYRAFSDVIDMKVCVACASEAWGLGLTIEALDQTRSLNPAARWQVAAVARRLPNRIRGRAKPAQTRHDNKARASSRVKHP